MGFSEWRAQHRVFKWYTWRLAYCSGLLAMSSLSYGFDTQAFNGVQALSTFVNQFGEPEGPKGAKVSKYRPWMQIS